MNDSFGPMGTRGLVRLTKRLHGVYSHQFDRVVAEQIDEPLSDAERAQLRAQMLRQLDPKASEDSPVMQNAPWLADALIGGVLNGMSLRARIDRGYALKLARSHFADAWPTMKHFRLRDLTRDPV